MKLLQKTIRGYLIYSVFILLIAIPAFYFVIQNILRHEIDEELLATKDILRPKLMKALNEHTLYKIDFLDQNISIAPSNSLQQSDSLFTINAYDPGDRKMIPYRVLYSNFSINGQGFYLDRKISLIENDDLIKSIVKVQVGLLLLLLIGLFFINRSLSKKIWFPFYQTLDKLSNYNVEQHTSLSLKHSEISEFTDLNKSLEALTERTHQTFISQKEFTENASHEMQTPLAIFQSKLELLMQTSPLNEEQAGLMDELADAAQRMRRLNKSLVLLTKIENNQFLDTEDILLNDIISQYSRQYQPQIEEKEITVIYEATQPVTLKANKVLIEILVSNLMGNAIRHNHPKGSISLSLQQYSWTIVNSGKTVSLIERNLFQRFQKDSTDTNSIGLGLEIAKKITDLYGYKIAYQFINNLHSFTISFPVG